jgi:predicted adenylyl cyclase CyaB
MYEKEIKIIWIKKDKIIDTLHKKWAKLLTSHQIVDHYYDREWDKLKKIGCSFRIRTIWDQNILTFKSKIPSKKFKSCFELENHTSLSHFNFIIQFTWMQYSWSKSKWRTSYQLWDCKVEIDEYLGMEPIVEIEGPNYQSIKKTIKLLWLSDHKKLTCGYRWLTKYI